MDAVACTQRELADLLAALGLVQVAESFKSASLSDARWLARDVARELDTGERGQLPHAFTAFALAVKHSQPGLEDIAERNLRSARRFAGLSER
jgi:hypothetical protein